MRLTIYIFQFEWYITPYKPKEYQPAVKAFEGEEAQVFRKYQVDIRGNINLCQGKEENVGEYDILMNQKGEEIKVKDTRILPQLAKSDRIAKAEVSMRSKKDLAKIFLFVADYCSSEWKFIRTTKNKYIIATKFHSEKSPSNKSIGIKMEQIFADIHSHPTKNEKLTMLEEKKTMGYYLNARSIYMPFEMGNNDWLHYRNNIHLKKKVPRKYVYMTGSGRLWKITYKGPDPEFIRTIDGNYERLFFGIF